MVEHRFPRWRELLDERLEEAVRELGAVPGVRGLVLGGSVARGEPWPMSDIDIMPISAATQDTEDAVNRVQARMVDWWAASGRAQTLDVSWLRFDDDEVAQAVASDASYAVERITDLRWFHGIDKCYGGRGEADPDGVADAFARWVTKVRFDPALVAARVGQWKAQVRASRQSAQEARERGDRVEATLRMRDAARHLRLVLLEGWGERLGSMGREWTCWERMAKSHGAADLAGRVAVVANASPADALERARGAPTWLNERIDLAFEARRLIGEDVTEQESARDQLAAFAVHVPRHRPPPWGDWLGLPDPALDEKLEELDGLIGSTCA